MIVVKNKTLSNFRIKANVSIAVKDNRKTKLKYPNPHLPNAIPERVSDTPPKAALKAEKLHWTIMLP